ncbi:MAG TPA: DUF2269 domain-containing protein [Steroidobacteraceae bacterium]|nr:DUF2269 domain-containing protein [Steroidobacteraceae bacterium]
MDYLTLKTVHVVSSVLLVGTGFGSAFYLFFANRSNSVEAIGVVGRLVVRADWYFTTPAAVIQPVTGAMMMHKAGWPLSMTWIHGSIALYVLAGACWIPVLFLQVRMARLADTARREGSSLPPEYWTLARRWELLGYPAFAAMLVVFYLMVAKPV